MWMRVNGKRTKYPGVYQIDEKTFRIRAKALDPRTGKARQKERLLEGVSAPQAAKERSEWIEKLCKGEIDGAVPIDRPRVGGCATSWMKSKLLKLDSYTGSRYAEALEQHALEALGDYYFDALRATDVQKWIDDELREGYKVSTVKGWFRVFRTMVRDHLAVLDLPRDPTMRISFPEQDDTDERNALGPEELNQFLEAMRAKYPQHYPLVAVLAFTGLRFCHASALRWEDIDETTGVIRVQRKQVRGVVGNVSRRKRAPKEIPLHRELAKILKEHRKAMIGAQAPGLSDGWCFPSDVGSLRTPSSLQKAWATCLKAAGIKARFTVHGLRRTFNDLARKAKVDAVVTKALTGHVTEKMREHYSSVDLEEKRAAVSAVGKLVPILGGKSPKVRTGVRTRRKHA
jgi:integrase